MRLAEALLPGQTQCSTPEHHISHTRNSPTLTSVLARLFENDAMRTVRGSPALDPAVGAGDSLHVHNDDDDDDDDDDYHLDDPVLTGEASRC